MGVPMIRVLNFITAGGEPKEGLHGDLLLSDSESILDIYESLLIDTRLFLSAYKSKFSKGADERWAFVFRSVRTEIVKRRVYHRLSTFAEKALTEKW